MLTQTRKIQQKDIWEFSLEDISKFAEILKYHSDLYYNKQEPIISDSEYDELLKKLQTLEDMFWITGHYSNMVWAELIESSFEKVAHSRPMISLDNTYNEQDLQDFNTRILKLSWQEWVEYTIEFKFDGLWIELIYDNWKLIQAITRGNWVEGEDVTQNIMQIDNIPKKIAISEHIEVRGEVVMPLSSFDELNKIAKQEWEKVFSNPRNAAAGSIRMKDNRVTKQRKLQFFAYDMTPLNPAFPAGKQNSNSYYDAIYNIEKLWFDISSYFIKCTDIDEVIKTIHNFGDTKKKIDFEIDGLVLKVENTDLWEDIGSTEHHPRYAIAYKFPSDGAMISRATLHNYDEVDSLGVHVWDNVFIKRAW